MKRILLIPFCLFFSVFIHSCSEPTHSDADRLCNCYDALYRATDEDMEVIGDSCNTIFTDIISKLKENPEEKEKFDKAYAVCQ